MTVLRLLLLWILVICYIIAWIFSMLIIQGVAREKGHPDIVARLWFIGIFGLIFTPAIIVAALPDRKTRPAASGGSGQGAQVGGDSDSLPGI